MAKYKHLYSSARTRLGQLRVERKLLEAGYPKYGRDYEIEHKKKGDGWEEQIVNFVDLPARLNRLCLNEVYGPMHSMRPETLGRIVNQSEPTQRSFERYTLIEVHFDVRNPEQHPWHWVDGTLYGDGLLRILAATTMVAAMADILCRRRWLRDLCFERKLDTYLESVGSPLLYADPRKLPS